MTTPLSNEQLLNSALLILAGVGIGYGVSRLLNSNSPQPQNQKLRPSLDSETATLPLCRPAPAFSTEEPEDDSSTRQSEFHLSRSQSDAGLPKQNLKYPPFEKEVLLLLKHCSLCYLSTTRQTPNAPPEPHLSLMKFTYDRESNVLVMTTRRDTNKFRNLQANPRVAVLVHDFPQHDVTPEGAEGAVNAGSLTLYGNVRLPGTNASEERYRRVHLDNPHCQGYSQFIKGAEYAVLLIDVDFAMLCDKEDKVQSFNYKLQSAQK